MDKMIAVLTPTYNRAYIISQLFKSLQNQSCYNFVWYVVNDGSTDNTDMVINSLTTDKFEIVYLKKQNGGKHTAINHALDYIKEELVFIVDSDDFLTSDAIETIVNDWNRYRDTPLISGISYLRINQNGEIIGQSQGNGYEFVDTYINIRINSNISGDKAEVYKTSILKSNRFPVFEGEKFITENVVWLAISKLGYKMVFINKAIYVCEYLDDGLTNAGRIKLKYNPMGAMEQAKSYFHKDIKQIYHWKYMILYVAASLFARGSQKKAYISCPEKFKFICTYLFGALLYFYYSVKWRENK